MSKVTGMSEEQLLVTVLPGLPTTAEIFIVPEKRVKDGSVDERQTHLDQVDKPRFPLIIETLLSGLGWEMFGSDTHLFI